MMKSINLNAPSRQAILVVDDFAAVRHLLVSLLQDSGYRTVEAENGVDALEKLSCEPFDLILTDICMPGIDGFELVRAVRELAPKASVVIMTGAGKLAAARGGIGSHELCVDAVCLKPFRTNDVLETVRGLLAA
jgi:CheY-like chemotaxis protein